MTRSILHVDMDAFFASIEVRDAPALRGQPVLVGGTGRRGVVAAASYEARRYGCRSAQPMAIARRLCPHAVVLPPRFSVYSEVSRQLFAIFEEFTPLVEPLSIDEAFLDMTGTERLFGTPRAAAELIRARVRAQCELTCSVGISTVKFIAKIASGRNKPDGVTEVPPGQELAFLGPLAVEELWGVGPKTAEQLRSRGIRTVADLRVLGEPSLRAAFGAAGTHLHELAHAIDPRPVVPERAPKQLSVEDTYAEDLSGHEVLRARLVDQATRLADRLVRSGWKGRTVVLKLRDGAFATQTRQRKLGAAVFDARTLVVTAESLLRELSIEGRSFRLTGIAVTELEPMDATRVSGDEHAQPVQMELGWSAEQPREQQSAERLQQVLSAVRQRFGTDALRIAGAESEDPEVQASRGAHTRRFRREP